MLRTQVQSVGFRLQEGRDLAVLRGLFESRLMTAAHIATLHFDGKSEATKKRLQKLKAAGLIGEHKRLVGEAAILFLTRKGFTLLRHRGFISDTVVFSASAFQRRANVSDITIPHELEVMDVKTVFHAALGKSDRFDIDEFSTWPRLHEFRALRPGHGGKEVLVKPDGYIRIREKEDGTKGYFHDFFLEVDRSSELPDRLVAQARCYVDYYSSGGFAIRNHATRAEFKDFPFRVLVVLKTAERRNNLTERLLQCNPPILTQVCLSTLKEVTADPLGTIWLRPQEYREATLNTPFDAERKLPAAVYRRQSERDWFVESKIQKRRLLGD